jgi:hypothetical protein
MISFIITSALAKEKIKNITKKTGNAKKKHKFLFLLFTALLISKVL